MAEDVVDPYLEVKQRDPFVGVFDIHVNFRRGMLYRAVRIVHWRMSQDATVFYLLDEDGGLWNFNHISYMERVGD